MPTPAPQAQVKLTPQNAAAIGALVRKAIQPEEEALELIAAGRLDQANGQVDKAFVKIFG